jgi:hypothetical protein
LRKFSAGEKTFACGGKTHAATPEAEDFDHSSSLVVTQSRAPVMQSKVAAYWIPRCVGNDDLL